MAFADSKRHPKILPVEDLDWVQTVSRIERSCLESLKMYPISEHSDFVVVLAMTSASPAGDAAGAAVLVVVVELILVVLFLLQYSFSYPWHGRLAMVVYYETRSRFVS